MPNTLGLGLGATLACGDAVSVAVEVGSTLADGETDGVGETEDVVVDVGETDGDGDTLPHDLATCWIAITVDGAKTPFGKCGSGPSIPSKRVVPITNSTWPKQVGDGTLRVCGLVVKCTLSNPRKVWVPLVAQVGP